MSQTKKRKKAEPRSDRARNWKENLHDLPESLLNEVVREIDRQEGNIETKTLAQIANKCSLLNHMCKNCLGECEFEGTPTFLGKWVSEAEHRAKIERLKVKMYNQARTEIEEATRKDIFDLQNKLAKAEADYNFLHDCCMEWADLKRVLEGENAKLKNEIAEERTGNEFLNTENLALMGDCVAYQKRLEAIKSLYENRPKRRPFIKGMKGEECYLNGDVDEFLKGLGVLLVEPKSEGKK